MKKFLFLLVAFAVASTLSVGLASNENRKEVAKEVVSINVDNHIDICIETMELDLFILNCDEMASKEFKFANGQEVKDEVTGFQGVITGTCFYLTGGNQYLVTAKSKKGNRPIEIWHDEGRIVPVDSIDKIE